MHFSRSSKHESYIGRRMDEVSKTATSKRGVFFKRQGATAAKNDPAIDR
jgi:hypothetical protein